MKSPRTPQEAAERVFLLFKVFAPSCAVMVVVLVALAYHMDRSGWSRLDGLVILNTGGFALVVVALLLVVYVLAYMLKFKES